MTLLRTYRTGESTASPSGAGTLRFGLALQGLRVSDRGASLITRCFAFGRQRFRVSNSEMRVRIRESSGWSSRVSLPLISESYVTNRAEKAPQILRETTRCSRAKRVAEVNGGCRL